MSRFKVTLDHAAIARMLREQFAPAVNEIAQSIGDEVTAELAAHPNLAEIADHVEVTPWVTDRARPSVRIAHPAGHGIEARDGVLTKAAARHGLEVKDKRR